MGLFSYIKEKTLINLSSHAEYRFSTIAVILISIIFGFTTVFITYSVYSITEKGVPEWSFYEITFMIGIYQLIMGLYHLTFDIEELSFDVKEGTLDQKLVSPLNVILQYYNFNIESFSSIIAAVVMFIIAIPNISLNLSISYLVFFVILLVISLLSIFSIKLLTSSTAFFITENHSIVENLNNIRSRFSNWPMNIYPKGLQLLFATVFPIAFICFVPASFILGKDVSFYFWISPIAVILFTLVSVKFFNYGLGKYSGTGS
ncbi:MAG: ABC-2 family transporter protein [Nanoarchaeota archaeon]|nr:ABC-2 family transporter protein [Nanoarchaeota archaeon]